MSDWRDHTNNMTVAERAESMAPEIGAYLREDVSVLTSFGHVCANAELERRRAVEAERDALAETAARLRGVLSDIAEERDWRESGHPLASSVISASAKLFAADELAAIAVSPAEASAAERMKGGAA